MVLAEGGQRGSIFSSLAVGIMKEKEKRGCGVVVGGGWV